MDDSSSGMTPVDSQTPSGETPPPTVDGAGDPAGAQDMPTADDPGDDGEAAAQPDPGPGASGACSFAISESISEVIPTVGIVEWTVDMPIDGAEIEFGLDTSYGLTVPVDLEDTNDDGAYRSLILGMKHSNSYNFRIVASSAGEQCTSENRTLDTGSLPNNTLAEPTVTTPLPDQLSGGYLISGRWGDNNDGPAFIMDKDNDYVWWYPAPQDVIRARMTYDGKGMWIRNTGQAKGSGVVLRVSMDGLVEERWELPPTTHDLAVMPDGRVGLTAWDDGACAEIQIFDPETETSTTIFNAQDAHGSSMCHVNNLQYYAGDDTFTFSDYNSDCYVKITSAGELVWVLNGQASDFTGTNWQRQHGLHILDANHLLVFSNGGAGQNSIAYELMLDESTMTADILWTYDPGVSAPYGGDVQRLDNGNTLVTFSSAGTIHEVNAAGELVQSMEWPINNTVSYSMKRDSLYGGPPPKVH
jgi:hypothetical protein